MRHLFIDFETRSKTKIEAGAKAYCMDKDFKAILVSYAIGANPTKVIDLTKDKFTDELNAALLDQETQIIAHNADFECNVLLAIGYNIPFCRFYCTRVAAAYLSLPQSLGELSRELGVETPKRNGKLEKKAMTTFSIKGEEVNAGNSYLWEIYKEYSAIDTEALRQCFNKMTSIPKEELSKYHDMLRFNSTGVRVDVERAEKVLLFYEYACKTLKEYGNTKFRLDIGNKNAVKRVLETDSLTKDKVKEMLAGDEVNPLEREMLEINQLLNQSSIAKLRYLVECNLNGRLYDQMKFYGAQRTGRDSSKGMQLQNLPAKSFDDLEEYFEQLKASELKSVEGAIKFLERVSAFIRSCIIPDEGYQLISLDFSSIEARVLSWLAGSKERLAIFRGDGKIYEHTAAQLFHIPKDEVKKGSRERNIGKAAELAFGYQGGVSAFDNFSKGELSDMSQEEKKSIVGRWRTANREIVAFWGGVEKAFKDAYNYGEATYKMLYFLKIGKNLGIKLPSGRWLVYRDVRFSHTSGLTELRYDGSPNKVYSFMEFLEKNDLLDAVTPKSLYALQPKTKFMLNDDICVMRTGTQLTFFSFDETGEEVEEFKVTNCKFEPNLTTYSGKDLFKPPLDKYLRTSVYGGLITENVTQAIARDLMKKAIADFEKTNLQFTLQFFVHDELNGSGICNTPELLAQFKKIMSSENYDNDFWGKGIPVKAEIEVLNRYKK